METLIRYINNKFIYETLNQIDSEIICESLNCKILRDIATQLLKLKKADQEMIDDRKAKKEKEGSIYWGPTESKYPLFAEIFGTGIFSVKWSDISESDITKVDASSWDTSTPLNSSTIRKVINTKKEAMLVVQDPKTEKFDFIIKCGGCLVALNPNFYRGYDHKIPGDNWSGLNQKDKIEMCKGKILYYIDLKGKVKEYTNLINKRKEQQKGIIKLDPESLANLAEQNRERYEKLIVKMKSMKINNDPLFDKCNKVIKNITDLATKLAKDPVSNADLYNTVSYLVPYVGSTKRWEPSGRGGTGKYIGVDGLLPLLIEYSRYVKYTAADGSEWSLEQVKIIKKKIEDTLLKVEKLSNKYNLNIV